MLIPTAVFAWQAGRTRLNSLCSKTALSLLPPRWDGSLHANDAQPVDWGSDERMGSAGSADIISFDPKTATCAFHGFSCHVGLLDLLASTVLLDIPGLAVRKCCALATWIELRRHMRFSAEHFGSAMLALKHIPRQPIEQVVNEVGRLVNLAILASSPAELNTGLSMGSVSVYGPICRTQHWFLKVFLETLWSRSLSPIEECFALTDFGHPSRENQGLALHGPLVCLSSCPPSSSWKLIRSGLCAFYLSGTFLPHLSLRCSEPVRVLSGLLTGAQPGSSWRRPLSVG